MFFRPLVAVDCSGFRFKGRTYSWNDIQAVRVWRPEPPLRWLLGYPAVIPRAMVILKNGKKIRVNGRALEKKGQKPQVGFTSSRSDAFDELVALFEGRAAQQGAAADRAPRGG